MPKHSAVRSNRWFAATVLGVICLGGFGLWMYWLNIKPAVSIPVVTLPAPNAYDFYTKAGSLQDRIIRNTPRGEIELVSDVRFNRTVTPQQLAQRHPAAAKITWIQRNDRVIKLLRQGFNYSYRQPPALCIKPDSACYRQYRNMAHLLVIESRTRAERGDWKGAAQSRLDILHLGHDIPRGGALIAGQVGFSVNAVGRREFSPLIPHLDAANARSAALQTEAFDHTRCPLAQIYQQEKWTRQVLMSYIMRNSYQFSDESLSSLLYFRKLPPSKQQLIENCATYMDAMSQYVALPYKNNQAPPTVSNDSLKVILETPSILAETRWRAAANETGDLQLATMLALHAFQLEHKHYPTILQELTPRYLKQVPRDPFGAGEPMRYRKAGNTYMLYSIGSDGIDDGGKSIDNPTRPAISRHRFLDPDSKGDVVAGINE